MAADVLERGAVRGRALGQFAQEQLPVRAARQMPALAVRRGAVGNLHHEGQRRRDEIAQNAVSMTAPRLSALETKA